MIKVIKFFLKSSGKQIIMIAIVSMVTAGLNVLSLKYLQKIVSSEDHERLYYLGIVVLFVIAVILVTLIMEKYSMRHFELKLVEYREEISTRILMVRYENIKKKLPRLAPILMEEINEINDFGKLIPAFIVAMVQIIAILGYLLSLSWQLAITVLVLFILVVTLIFIGLPSIKKLKNKRSKTRFQLYAMFELMNNGFKNLIMSSQHSKSYVSNSIRPPSLETAKYNGNIHMLKVRMEQMINGLLIIGFGIVLILYFNWIELGQGIGVQFMALLIFILPSFIRVVDFFNQLKNAENSLDQINSLNANISSEFVSSDESLPFETRPGKSLITLDNVEYFYNNNEHGFRLDPFSFDIKENEIIILKGGNGSGKTTLFNLITSLYTPVRGKLYFQENEITENNQRSYRDLFSCYFTNSPVFDDLTYIPEKNFEKAKRYIEDWGLKDKTSLSASTLLDTNLSFGQRGRLNLLRLLLEDRSIYILDEWAANQDIHFKEKFYLEIIPMLKNRGKTVILISHDDLYYHIADKIVTLRNGRLDSIVNNVN